MPLDTRTKIAPENLTAVFGASRSIGRTVATGQAQFSTPTQWANYFAGLLPNSQPPHVFDPQCAAGNLFTGLGYYSRKYGFEIDSRFDRMAAVSNPTLQDKLVWSPAADQVYRLRGHCMDIWATLDEVAPKLRFACQVANPPFGALWKGETEDSVAVTWREIQKRACPGGFGYFICPRSRAEELGLTKHERVYLVLNLPPGFFEGVTIEITVVFWLADGLRGSSRPPSVFTIDIPPGVPPGWLESRVGGMREWFQRVSHGGFHLAEDVHRAWELLATVLRDDEKPRPEWNLYLQGDGTLCFDMTLRSQLHRKLTDADLKRLAGVHGQHPLTLIVEAETRKLLRELTEEQPNGDQPPYTVQPAARVAVERALASACTAQPVMPVTDFERVAYADELAGLTVRRDYQPHRLQHKSEWTLPRLIPGKLYPITTHGYAFTHRFTRTKTEYDAQTGAAFRVPHECSLSGQDRLIQVRDSEGATHRFLDRPGKSDPAKRVYDHPEDLLWEIFEAPPVQTVAEAHSLTYRDLTERLQSMELTMQA